MRPVFVDKFHPDDLDGIDRQGDDLFNGSRDSDWVEGAESNPSWTIRDSDGMFVLAMGAIPVSDDVGLAWLVADNVIKEYPMQAYFYADECAREAVEYLGISCLRCVVSSEFMTAQGFVENLGFEKILEQHVEGKKCFIYSRDF